MSGRITPSSFKRAFIGDDDSYAGVVPADDLLHVAGPYGPIFRVSSTATVDTVTIAGVFAAAAGSFSSLSVAGISTLNQGTFGPPTVSTRSVGTRIVLFPSLSSTNADYAIGVGSGGEQWYSVNGTARHAFYENATVIASLKNVNGLGQLTVAGITSTVNQVLGVGGSTSPYISYTGALSGVKTGGPIYLATLATSSDTVAAGGGGMGLLSLNLVSGGTGTTGNRVAMSISTTFSGGTGNKAAGLGSQYSNAFMYGTASGNVGGASGAGNDWGTLWGAVASSHLASGSTFWTASIGLEVNYGVSTGASAAYVQGLKIVSGNHNQAAYLNDYGLGFAKLASTEAGIFNGISFGSPDGYWPVDATGTLITTLVPTNASLPSPVAYTANIGVDMSGCAFTTAAFKSAGFAVNGSGTTTTTGQILGLRVVVAAGAVTVTATDDAVIVNKTTGAATTVNLPAGVTGRRYTIKDGKGDAAANNITITPAAGTIDGAATLVLATNYGRATVAYNGTQWNQTA